MAILVSMLDFWGVDSKSFICVFPPAQVRLSGILPVSSSNVCTDLPGQKERLASLKLTVGAWKWKPPEKLNFIFHFQMLLLLVSGRVNKGSNFLGRKHGKTSPKLSRKKHPKVNPYPVFYVQVVVSNAVCFFFTPKIGEDEPNLTFAYFSDGVGSTPNQSSTRLRNR